MFNPQLSGAKAFNAVVLQRKIDAWIDEKKRSITKRSGPSWGVLVHGNRILSAAVFKRFGPADIAVPIAAFRKNQKIDTVSTLCEASYAVLVSGVQNHYSGKFLALLFKNPTMSKHLFDLASTEAPQGELPFN